MAKTKVLEKVEVQKALSPDKVPDAFRLGEMGQIGYNVFAGVPQNELKSDLNFPTSLQTFKQMSYHSAVASSAKLFELVVSKATWKIKPPQGATKAEKKRAKLIEDMLHDMQDCTFNEFLTNACSAYIYGFSLFEKVFYKRIGGKYNDGITAVKKLAFRNQNTIYKWLFSEDGNDLTGVVQRIAGHNDFLQRYKSTDDIKLPRKKFLLFRTGQHNGSPIGRSPLIDAYVSWKFLTEIEKIEAQGMTRDLQGLPVNL